MNQEKIVREIVELLECVDECCGTPPIIQYNQQLKKFRILCKWCLEEAMHEETMRLMIIWNQQQRSNKLKLDHMKKLLDAVKSIDTVKEKVLPRRRMDKED